MAILHETTSSNFPALKTLPVELSISIDGCPSGVGTVGCRQLVSLKPSRNLATKWGRIINLEHHRWPRSWLLDPGRSSKTQRPHVLHLLLRFGSPEKGDPKPLRLFTLHRFKAVATERPVSLAQPVDATYEAKSLQDQKL
jgi:hypothetical protein